MIFLFRPLLDLGWNISFRFEKPFIIDLDFILAVVLLVVQKQPPEVFYKSCF